jgi:NAD(P)-dependent dehydrogenase (short-subunit alcohol dehydrogenase family)
MMAHISNEERKVLILTGASRGIGHATVKRFSTARWRVITCSRHPFPEDCPWEAGPEDHIQVDLGDIDDTIRAIAEMKDRLKAQGSRLSALVNNAAISPKGQGGSRLGTIETRLEEWKGVFQINFFAPIMLARGLIDELEAASGSVVNVSSIAGSRVHPFAGSAYATSKAALAALTREMAADFAPRGIRVNAISPGEIDTAILSPGTETLIANIPMGRLGLPEEVAKTIYFLCTDQSSYINGAKLHINGGQHV